MRLTARPDYRTLSRREFIAVATASGAAFWVRGAETPPYRIRQDWHMHTWRAGGKPDAIVKNIVVTNDRYGLDLMGISEHIDRIDERAEFTEKFKANRVEAATVETDMTVMIGTESTMINPTTCAVGDEIAAQLDYVLVSCNHYHLSHVENPEPGTPEAYAHHYLDMLMGAASLGYTDTIGHPFLHAKLRKKLGDEGIHAILMAYDEERLVEVLKTAAEADMAFEINPRHADGALEWFRDLVQEARLHGTKFTLGTDAHEIASLGYPNWGTRSCEQILADLTITDDDLKWTANKSGESVA